MNVVAISVQKCIHDSPATTSTEDIFLNTEEAFIWDFLEEFLENIVSFILLV